MTKNIWSYLVSGILFFALASGAVYTVTYFINNGNTEIKLPKNMSAEENEQPADARTASAQNTEITEDQVQAAILKEGSGTGAKSGDKVSVHYTGAFTNGEVFDSSIPRKTPFQFTLGAGQVIRGWEIGVAGMKVGEKRRLVIPPAFGYGEAGTPGGPIPPNATLIFEVELLKIN